VSYSRQSKFKTELSTPENLVLHSGVLDMIAFTEKVEPSRPARALSDEEAMGKLAEQLVQDDHWVKNLIDGLAGILRDVKH
jgi:hypothetical protein